MPPDAKPREAAAFDLEPSERAGLVTVREENVSALIKAPGAREARIGQGLGPKAPRGEVVARGRDARRFEHFGHRPLLRARRASGELESLGQWSRRAEPAPKLLADGSEGRVAATPLDEVDDRAVVAVVTNREVGPVPIAILAHDDLVARRGMAEHVARDAALASVAPVAVAIGRIVEKVNVALEPMQFVVVHGGLHG